MLDKNLIIIDSEYKTSEEVIKGLGDLLYNNQYVGKEFIQAVLDREKEYPTGIPSKFPIALPHTTSKFVNKSGIAIALLKEPVEFYQMGDNNKKLDVKIVVMLAIDNSKQHLKYLQRIMDIFEDHEILRQLECVDTVDDAYRVLSYINA